MPNTQKAINNICKDRQIPKIKKGAYCEVNSKPGKIWGGNHAANFNVKFDDGHISNCHPYWKMKIFVENKKIIYEYKETSSA